MFIYYKNSEWSGLLIYFFSLAHIPGPYELFIPHALTVVEEKGYICVADRQDGRVLCYHTNNGTFVVEISNPSAIGSEVYSVSYSPAYGNYYFLIEITQLLLYWFVF